VNGIPVNVPHARTIAQRIEARLAPVLERDELDTGELGNVLAELAEVLNPFDAENDPGEDCAEVCEQATGIARKLVVLIEELGVGNDRLGQAVRNLFECLGYAEEGAELSLRAGENPNSLLRPAKLD